LNANESRVLTSEWNTTGVPYSNYALSAEASTVLGKAARQDHLYIVKHLVTVISGVIVEKEE